jgi:hypothetical protein
MLALCQGKCALRNYSTPGYRDTIRKDTQQRKSRDMAKAKQQSSSASQRRAQVKKQRQQRQSSPSSDNQNKRRVQKKNQSPWLLIGGVLLALAAVIGIFFFLSRQSTSTGNPTPTAQATTSPAVLQAVTNVSAAVSASVGTGGQGKVLVPLKGPPPPPALTGPNAKPEFFYAGAEYCPFCAAQRWAVVVALSRFGTFSKLNQTTSSATDVYPNTATFSFYQAAYTSQFIYFDSVEQLTNQPDGNGSYTVLQTPTPAQQQLITTYDGPPYLSSAGSIPFINIANQYAMQGANYSPQVLAGLSMQDIANKLSDPNSDVTKGIVGSANYLTAAICLVTNQQPAASCSAAPIPQIEQSLGKSAHSTNNMQISSLSPFREAVVRQPVELFYPA